MKLRFDLDVLIYYSLPELNYNGGLIDREVRGYTSNVFTLPTLYLADQSPIACTVIKESSEKGL